ncbi:MAG: NAD-dependent 4,6-dehydratase LegB, partial [Candidatus Hermodarchaeota archaeon]
MNLENKRVLITGSDGFIGSHLVERFLKENCKIRAFVYYNSFNSWGWLDTFAKEQLDKIEVFPGDIRDSYIVRKAVKDVDIVCHLAALIGIPYSYIAPESYIDTNVKGTLNIIQAAKDFKTEKIIITSTSETYGSALKVPIDEKHPYQPQSPYSASKIAADHISMSYYYSFDLPISIIRPFNTYGPRQSARAIIPTIITQIFMKNEKIELGNLYPTRDLTYVLDLCEAYIKMCQTSIINGQIINIGNSKEISIKDLVNKIKDLMNSDIEIISHSDRIRPDSSEVNRLCADTKKARDLLDWKPKYSLTDGLKATIEWF